MRSTFCVFCLLLGFHQYASASYPQLQQLLEQKKYTEAIERGESLMREHPDHAHAAFMTAYAYQQTGQQQKAINLYQKVIAENPELPEPRNNLAMIYLSQGDYDRASQLLVQAINTHSSYATAYENLSRIYKGIASEAYRRAVNESNAPARYAHDIQLAAITHLESAGPVPAEVEPAEESSVITTANLETYLVEQVKGWAESWSVKDFDTYTDYYDSEYRGNLPSHRAWVDYRRKRVLKPGEINVEVSNIKIDWRGESRVLLDFEQAFESPTYSDRVLKRLVFSKRDSEWKITEEWVLSVL
jgi:tetratricopeptide (TPR) repeat protein